MGFNFTGPAGFSLYHRLFRTRVTEQKHTAKATEIAIQKINVPYTVRNIGERIQTKSLPVNIDAILDDRFFAG